MTLQAFEHVFARTAAEAPGAAPLRRVAAQAVRAYDIRGVAGRDIDRDGAYALGLAYATATHWEGIARVGVGRDGRTSSPGLEQALVWGLMDGGLRVERIGLCTTPMLAYATRELCLDGAIMVTASHNPAQENGFKVLIGERRVHGAALRTLVDAPCGRAASGSARRTSIVEAYAADLIRAADGVAPLKVAWDCGHGATGPLVERLTAHLPGEHHLLNAEVDGRFPAHAPDPTVPANLAQLAECVTSRGCDLGIAFDGDGDRIGVVDADGRILWTDQLLLLLARDLLAREPGAMVVADGKCANLLFDGIAAAGGRSARSPSGYVHVREAMAKRRARLGGELSGHIFFADGWGGADDAIYAAVQTLLAVSRLPGGLAAFRDSLPASYATPELRIPCADGRKAAVVSEAVRRVKGPRARCDATLGLRVETPDGWWLLRASGTEPVLSARCESRHPDGLDRLRAALGEQLRLSGVEADV